MKNFEYVKVGDVLIRRLAGTIPLEVIVGDIKDGLIHTGSLDGMVPYTEGWRFRVDNGAEVDEDLGWDGLTKTGSYLIHTVSFYLKNN